MFITYSPPFRGPRFALFVALPVTFALSAANLACNPDCADDIGLSNAACSNAVVVKNADGSGVLPDLTDHITIETSCDHSDELNIEQFPPANTRITQDTDVSFTVERPNGNVEELPRKVHVALREACGIPQQSMQDSDRPIHVTGAIDDVLTTTESFKNQNFETLRTIKDTRFHIVLDLHTTDIAEPLAGTAQVTWTSHNYDVRTATCGDGTNVEQHYDWQDRQWTVNLTATLDCEEQNGETVLRLTGSGTPDGSDVPQPYVISENCTPYRADRTSSGVATWGSLSETGIDRRIAAGEPFDLRVKHDLAIPTNTTGEHYIDVKLDFRPASP